jgi:hypothetical protein
MKKLPSENQEKNRLMNSDKSACELSKAKRVLTIQKFDVQEELSRERVSMSQLIAIELLK